MSPLLSDTNLGRRLLSLKEELNKLKEQRSELQGEFRMLMTNLKEDFQVNSLDEAEKALATMTRELKQLEARLKSQVVALEEELRNGK